MDAYSNNESEQSNKRINYSFTQHGYMPRYIKVKKFQKISLLLCLYKIQKHCMSG